MQLSFQSPFLSIKAFRTIEIPAFAVISGLNGSGKSHLLQAIFNGQITNSIVTPPSPAIDPGPVRLLTNISPLQDAQIVGPYNTSMNPPGVLMGASYFESARMGHLAPHLTNLEASLGSPVSSLLKKGEDAWRIGPSQLISRATAQGSAPNVEAVKAAFLKAEQSMEDLQPTPMPGRELLVLARQVANKLDVSPLSLVEDQIKQFQHWGSSDIFQANMANVFGRYRDAWLRNRHLQMNDQDNGSSLSLTNDQFESGFGQSPWITLNETLHKFGLPYQVETPNMYDYSPVGLNLIKNDTGEAVALSNLSSGERVLFLFALASFQYDEERINIVRPKVLLLDEMDASLHPAMVQRWISAIVEGLVGEQGMHCILTTHSPTTVALCPEESLYEMIDGKSGIRKITKQQALNNLTFGVPTLSIDYSGRRQVFVESDTDAGIYERCYSVIKALLQLPRQLNFLSTGRRNKDGGETNSGCSIVKALVQQLSETGNQSIFGLVDWDGEATSSARIRVLAEGRRDGLENVLLDPLLVCFLLVKNHAAPVDVAQMATRFIALGDLSDEELQTLVDSVQAKLDYPTDDTGSCITAHYMNGKILQLRVAYAQMDDHQLESQLTKKFPLLRKYTARGRGELVKAVVEEVLVEYPAFCPTEIKAVFEDIATATIAS